MSDSSQTLQNSQSSFVMEEGSNMLNTVNGSYVNQKRSCDALGDCDVEESSEEPNKKSRKLFNNSSAGKCLLCYCCLQES